MTRWHGPTGGHWPGPEGGRWEGGTTTPDGRRWVHVPNVGWRAAPRVLYVRPRRRRRCVALFLRTLHPVLFGQRRP